MNLLQRLTATVSEKANQLLDRYDDPCERLDHAYQLLIEQLASARRSAGDLDVAERRLAGEAKRLGGCISALEAQARTAVRSGSDDIAREAIARCSVIRTGLNSLATERDQVTDEDDRFSDAVELVQSTLGVLAAKREALKAGYAANRDKVDLEEAISQIRDEVANVGAGVARADALTTQLTDQCERLGTRLASGALLDLTSPLESIRTELDEARGSLDVERNLVAMKAR